MDKIECLKSKLALLVGKTLLTSGDGHWSSAVRNVTITDIKVSYDSDWCKYASVKIFFSRNDWLVRKDGLIYTDTKFLKLAKAFTGLKLDYSEQGLQGSNFVHMDCKV